MATVPVPTYTYDCVIGPDGQAWPRGDDTDSGTGSYYWSGTTPTFEATPESNAVANSDTAWIQYALTQYPEGGVFRILPPNPGVGVYFDAHGGSGATQGINDDGEFVTIPFNGTTIICGKRTQFRFYIDSDSNRLFLCDKTNFKWSGGFFVYDGDGTPQSNQSFIVLSGGADFAVIEDATFQINSTGDLQNFACINLAGADSSATVDDALKKPTIRNCHVVCTSIKPAVAYSTTHTAGATASNWYQGIMLKANDCLQLTVDGCSMYANAAHATAKYGGGFMRLDNCQFSTISGLTVFGVQMIGVDGTGGTGILLFSTGGEGHHTTITNSFFELIDARHIIESAGTLYNNINNCSFGRVGCHSCIHTIHAVNTAAEPSFHLMLEGNSFHNVNASTGAAAYVGHSILLEYVEGVYVGPVVHSLIQTGDLGIRVESTASRVMREGKHVVWVPDEGFADNVIDTFADGAGFVGRRTRYTNRDEKSYWRAR